MSVIQLFKILQKQGKGKVLPWFKQGKGQYAEHDKFLGISAPIMRKLAREYQELPLVDVKILLQSPYNEVRSVALFILVLKYERARLGKEKHQVFNFYIKNMKAVNNWNLVDISAHKIIGAHLWKKKRIHLYRWAKDKNLWKRRIAIVSTWYFIQQKDFKDTLKIAIVLSKDKEDLIHKAAGWMLREVGKKDRKVLKRFLNKYAKQLPRTTLRYAIEHFSAKQRQSFMELR